MSPTQTAVHQHPLRTALYLTGLTITITLVAAALINLLAPGMDPLQQRLIAVLALAVFACVVVAVRSRELFVSGRLNPVLLIVPVLVTLAPFAGGIRDVGLEAGTTIVLGYLATGVYEELWFRGLVLNSLATWTPVRAALLSSALFGSAHLANISFGANPAITAAQVVGATCFGMGLAALRLRGCSLGPLILLHALGDIALQIGDVSSAWRWSLMVGGDVILLVFGLFLLRSEQPRSEHLPPRGNYERTA